MKIVITDTALAWFKKEVVVQPGTASFLWKNLWKHSSA